MRREGGHIAALSSVVLDFRNESHKPTSAPIYRPFCRLRDATFTLMALPHLGYSTRLRHRVIGFFALQPAHGKFRLFMNR
jgi:hypothetical protein